MAWSLSRHGPSPNEMPGLTTVRAQCEGWNMRVAPLSRVFPQGSSRVPPSTALDEDQLRIGAAMAWINRRGNLDDFPSSRSERIALMTTAVRRGLVAWDRGHDRYKLTLLGKRLAASYAPKLAAGKVSAANSFRPLDSFEGRPRAAMAAFLALATTVGAAAAWTFAPDSSHTPSGLSGTLQATVGSPAPGSRGTAKAHRKAFEVAASPQQFAVLGGRQMRALDQALLAPVDHVAHDRPATMAGSVARVLATGHFEGDFSADAAERITSTTKVLDAQAISGAMLAESKPKGASHHHARYAKIQHNRTADEGRPWWQDGGARSWWPEGSALSFRAEGNPRQQGSAARPLRYHEDDHRKPARGRDNSMGPVGWLFR